MFGLFETSSSITTLLLVVLYLNQRLSIDPYNNNINRQKIRLLPSDRRSDTVKQIDG